MNDKLQ